MERDPSGQLAWLAAELEAAEAAGERVWLIGHMPLGTSDSFHDQSEYFDQIVQRFDATISALFFGHTHQDEFQISYSTPASPSADTAVMVSYIAPALTPTSGNPTFRVYSVDPVTFGILDYTVYYANISSQSYQSGPTWEVLYSVKEAYGSLVNPPVTDASAELTPAFWHDLTVLFEENDDVYQTWYARRGRDYSEATCTGTCKTTSICQLRAAQSQYNWYVSATCRPPLLPQAQIVDMYSFSATISPGINFKRDTSNTTAIPHGDCEGSVAIPIFSSSTFQSALVATMEESFLNTQIPDNYTVPGWNSTG